MRLFSRVFSGFAVDNRNDEVIVRMCARTSVSSPGPFRAPPLPHFIFALYLKTAKHSFGELQLSVLQPLLKFAFMIINVCCSMNNAIYISQGKPLALNLTFSFGKGKMRSQKIILIWNGF